MRRYAAWALVTALAFLAGGASTASATTRVLPYPPATTKVASGIWNGVSWTLFAGESINSTSFSHCVVVVFGTKPTPSAKGGGCASGGLRKPGELLRTAPPAPEFPYGIAYSGSSHCPTFFVVEGLVVASARSVA